MAGSSRAAGAGAGANSGRNAEPSAIAQRQQEAATQKLHPWTAGEPRSCEAAAIPIVESLQPPWWKLRPRNISRRSRSTLSSWSLCPRRLSPSRPPVGAGSEPAPAQARAALDRCEATAHPEYRLPSTDLLNEVPARNPYDSLELKEIAARIKSKFEEFNVHGSWCRSIPGPVVTTFEFKPEAGVKYSRITTLTEDLCLGLQAESILIERIPGKPTVGSKSRTRRREVISLRQILESEEFFDSHSRLTICLGKDINGRIKVAALESMPHLLIAGSTGAGKSVMLNSMIMSILYKSTPDEVRMILVDPKRLEMGLYEGIPHLLTPVITDPKKATYALRNAVLEMERRLKLLAGQGVRNIDQYNRKGAAAGERAAQPVRRRRAAPPKI